MRRCASAASASWSRSTPSAGAAAAGSDVRGLHARRPAAHRTGRGRLGARGRGPGRGRDPAHEHGPRRHARRVRPRADARDRRGRLGAGHRLGRGRDARPPRTTARRWARPTPCSPRRSSTSASTRCRRPSATFARAGVPVRLEETRRDASPRTLRFDANGLIPAVVQEAATGEVLMVAWMNAEALERTLATRSTHFWSRSRRALWQKGETSGHRQHVEAVYADCDGDTLLILAHQEGVACHTGSRTCFFTRLDRPAEPGAATGAPAAGPGILDAVERVIQSRRAAPREGSYVSGLLAGGDARLAQKVGEEAAEVMVAALAERLGAARGRGGRPLVPHPRADGRARSLGAPRLRGARPPAPPRGRAAGPGCRAAPSPRRTERYPSAGASGSGGCRRSPLCWPGWPGAGACVSRTGLRRRAEGVSRGCPRRLDPDRKRGGPGAPASGLRGRADGPRHLRGQAAVAAAAGARPAPPLRPPRRPGPRRRRRPRSTGCRARRSEFRATLDGVPVAVRAVTPPGRRAASTTWSASPRPRSSRRSRPDFERFAGSFALTGAAP